VDHRSVETATAKRSERRTRRCRDRQETAVAETREHRLGDPERRIAAGDHEPGSACVREWPRYPVDNETIRICPARAGDSVIRQLGGDEAIADASQPKSRPRTQRRAERGHDGIARSGIGEQLLDGRPKSAREAHGGVNSGRVTTRLHGRHELSAHARTCGELGLREPGLAASLAQ
jgi:hypothetical protein